MKFILFQTNDKIVSSESECQFCGSNSIITGILVSNCSNILGKKFRTDCSNNGSIRDHSCSTSRKNNLERIELSSFNKVSLV